MGPLGAISDGWNPLEAEAEGQEQVSTRPRDRKINQNASRRAGTGFGQAADRGAGTGVIRDVSHAANGKTREVLAGPPTEKHCQVTDRPPTRNHWQMSAGLPTEEQEQESTRVSAMPLMYLEESIIFGEIKLQNYKKIQFF